MTTFETDRAVRIAAEWMLGRHDYVEMPATLVEMLISIERQAMDREYTRTLPEAIHPRKSRPILAGAA